MASQVVDGVFPGVTTAALDTLAAETAAYKTTQHPDYAILAARIAVSNLHKQTKPVRRAAAPRLRFLGFGDQYLLPACNPCPRR